MNSRWPNHCNHFNLADWKLGIKTPVIHQFPGSPHSLRVSRKCVWLGNTHKHLISALYSMFFCFWKMLAEMPLTLWIHELEYNWTVSVNTRGSTDTSIKLTQSLHLMSSVEWVFHLQVLLHQWVMNQRYFWHLKAIQGERTEKIGICQSEL